MYVQRVVIRPGYLQGSIAAPPSKSVMQRVLAVLLLRRASLLIHHPGDAADDKVLRKLLQDAGFTLSLLPTGSLAVTAPGPDSSMPGRVHFGESGLAARMCTPVLALQDTIVSLEAAPALQRRPMDFLEGILPQLGVQVQTTNGSFPATIRGPLIPRDISIDASVSSQVLTGLLLAYSGAAAHDVSINVKGLVSRPYIDLTLNIMEALGLPVPVHKGYTVFYFPAGTAMRKMPADFTIEGDWSATAVWLVAGAIAGPITIASLDVFTTQGDKKILEALADAGAGLSIESTQITVRPAPLKAFHFDAADCPDLFPALAVLAAYAKGTSVITGVSRLMHKESNRALTIQSELGKMGADIVLQDDLMIIHGGLPLQGATVLAHHDHRIAMMCAIAALRAEGATTIDGADAVAKSYPRFFEDLKLLGGNVSFPDNFTAV